VVRPPPAMTTSRGSDQPPTAVSSSSTTQTQIQDNGKTKSKAEKLYDMHLRKLRSLAKPLDPKRRDGEKRFFEWGIGDVQNARKWADSGKWEGGKLERSWVLQVSSTLMRTARPPRNSLRNAQETPTGKVLDLLIAASKTSRPISTSPSESAQVRRHTPRRTDAFPGLPFFPSRCPAKSGTSRSLPISRRADLRR
jgi:hypothetical protein